METFVRSRARHLTLAAFLAGLAGVIGSYAVAGYSRDFLVAPIDDLVVKATPGPIVAWMIQNVGEQGHLLHIAISFGIATGLLAGVAGLGFLVGRRTGQPLVGAGIAGIVSWIVVVAMTGASLAAVGAAVPLTILTGILGAPVTRPGFDRSRRRAIASGVGLLGLLGGSVLVRNLVAGDGTAADGSGDVDEAVTPMLDQAAEQSLDISGNIPGLVSTFDEFYNVDIAEFDPEIPSDTWSLAIGGDVEETVAVDFADLTTMPTEHRHVTLRCVGESLNGHKLDNAVWTGTPIKPLLEQADPNGDCGCAMLQADDGYFVQFPLAALEDAFLAWGMNGQPLPQSHGHPVRVLVPGHWGETNVKWLSEIELLDEEMDGYWEQRGWHGTGPVNTVAKIWSDTVLENGHIEVAGHAYAGTRGIEQVEISTDGGTTWNDAELSAPLPGEDVWRQWRYEFSPDGTHEVVARAIDGEGTVQPSERSDSFPSGATGWVTRTVDG